MAANDNICHRSPFYDTLSKYRYRIKNERRTTTDVVVRRSVVGGAHRVRNDE